MTELLIQLVPPATNIGRAFQKHQDRSSSDSSGFVLVLVGIACVVTAAVALMYYLERRRAVENVKVDSEQIFFRELCRLHALSNLQISQLQALAESSRQPICDLFVDPAILDNAIAAGYEKRYGPLKRKLFGETVDDPSKEVEAAATQ